MLLQVYYSPSTLNNVQTSPESKEAHTVSKDEVRVTESSRCRSQRDHFHNTSPLLLDDFKQWALLPCKLLALIPMTHRLLHMGLMLWQGRGLLHVHSGILHSQRLHFT